MRTIVEAPPSREAIYVTLERGTMTVDIRRNDEMDNCPVCKTNVDIVTVCAGDTHSVSWCTCGHVYVTERSRTTVVHCFE